MGLIASESAGSVHGPISAAARTRLAISGGCAAPFAAPFPKEDPKLD